MAVEESHYRARWDKKHHKDPAGSAVKFLYEWQGKQEDALEYALEYLTKDAKGTRLMKQVIKANDEWLKYMTKLSLALGLPL